MINEQEILSCIEHTLISDAKVIKQAEDQLYEYQKQPGFTTFLLNVVANEDIPMNIRLSSAIYMKNKIQRSWNTTKYTEGIKPEEQENIKQLLIPNLIKFSENSHLRPHITEAIRGILNADHQWNLTPAVKELLTSGKPEYLYPGLLLVFEVCIVHRWDMSDNREVIDEFILEVFPIIEGITSELVNQSDYRSNELLYLVLKSFKYGCLNNLPKYFLDVDKLNAWIHLHLYICQKPLPAEVLELDPNDRSLDRRVKVNKWGFGNLTRFLYRYSRTTKVITKEFVNYVFSNIVPNILQEYFKFIESWSNKSLWLGEASLYYLVQFLEKCMITNDLYPLVEPHLNVVIQHLVFPCLCANEQSVELLEDDPEEYTRRYFDLNKDGSMADFASSDFVFMLGTVRPEKLNDVLMFINDVFTNFSQHQNNIEWVYKQEGAMRMISTLFGLFQNPQDLEGIFSHYIVNFLTQTEHKFLIARALENIASYTNSINDMATLSKLFELTYSHFLNSDVLPIQVEAADALKSLVVSNPNIHSHISAQVPGIMEKLLKLSKEFEIDILSEVMEAFVENFADELTPFAKDLAVNLADQFLNVGRSIIESNNGAYSTGDQDQESQAAALLATMTTMVMSMNKVSLIEQFSPVVKFIIVHAQISFITEIVDLMDSMALSSKALYNQFVPEIWEMFHDVMDSFQTYALDYFESYLVFFETVVLQGFPQDQTYVEPFLSLLDVKLESEIDYDVEGVMNLLTCFALSMKETAFFEKAMTRAMDEELALDNKQVIKMVLAYLFVKPVETLQVLEKSGITLEILKRWFDIKFTSVFALKLQILAIMSILKLQELPSSISGFMKEFSNKLVTSVEQLPVAIRNREAINKGEELSGGVDGTDLLEPQEEDEYLEEYEDDLKETVLDEVNAFQEVSLFLSGLQNENPQRYQDIISSMNDDKKESLQVILEFVANN
ncbi:Importin beta SMX1 [Nakaseomyces bracarensis]|uniref:Importin beta SMX1 n=1 Tax=Nakaseomyces bracarensis TaxID=273131 RepID=A0ABR4NTW0_9SACH